MRPSRRANWPCSTSGACDANETPVSKENCSMTQPADNRLPVPATPPAPAETTLAADVADTPALAQTHPGLATTDPSLHERWLALVEQQIEEGKAVEGRAASERARAAARAERAAAASPAGRILAEILPE